MDDYRKLYYANQQCFLAYHKYLAKENNKHGLIFLGGFKSDMNGTKAQAIFAYAKKNNYDFLRFDYSGHGQSSGNFIDGTIGLWLQNTLAIIDSTDKPQILIGSSMGGWIMILAALMRPNKILALIGLAAAADFTEEAIWNCMTAEEKERIVKDKQIQFGNEFCSDSYPISLELIMQARQHLLLDKEIRLNLPIRLIHGMEDKDIPYSTSIRIAERVTSKDVSVHLLKDSGHRLSEPTELELIYQVISEVYSLNLKK